MPTLHIRILDVHHQSATALPRVHYSKGPTIQPCRDAVRHMYLFGDSCAALAAAPSFACSGRRVGRASVLGADSDWQINEGRRVRGGLPQHLRMDRYVAGTFALRLPLLDLQECRMSVP